MLKYVYDFNKIRNGFKYDPELEKDMYAEEVIEFFDAKTLAERVDALTDCKYVRLGTKLKMVRNQIRTFPYSTDGETEMYDIIHSEITTNFMYSVNGDAAAPVSCSDNYGLVNKIIQRAEKIVCQCNELKVSKLDENGKVMKQHDLPNATLLIADMIEKVMRQERENA